MFYKTTSDTQAIVITKDVDNLAEAEPQIHKEV